MMGSRGCYNIEFQQHWIGSIDWIPRIGFPEFDFQTFNCAIVQLHHVCVPEFGCVFLSSLLFSVFWVASRVQLHVLLLFLNQLLVALMCGTCAWNGAIACAALHQTGLEWRAHLLNDFSLLLSIQSATSAILILKYIKLIKLNSKIRFDLNINKNINVRTINCMKFRPIKLPHTYFLLVP